jgi:hypothetical protein
MVIQFIKKYFIIIFVIVTSTICLNATNLSNEEPIKGDDSTEKALPAIKIELNGNYISPNGGIDLSEAKILLVAKLKKEGKKGNINSAIEVKEITTKEVWENIGVQLYKVDLDYAWINGIAIIKNNKVMEIFPGMPTEAVFLADLDNDRIYEIYSNFFIGSGIVSEEILGFDVASNEGYYLGNRMKQNFHLYIDGGILKAEVHHLKQSGSMFDKDYKTRGKVILKDINNGKELAIE